MGNYLKFTVLAGALIAQGLLPRALAGGDITLPPLKKSTKTTAEKTFAAPLPGAVKGAVPPGGKLSDEAARSVLFGKSKKQYANLCPSCGRERSVCHAESMKAQKSGQGKVCEVYKDSFVVGESRPVACPVCRHKVNLPKRGQRYENTDSDLCPHPDGNVRYMPEIALCPHCGYAAFQGDYFGTLSAGIRRWVTAQLQPHMVKALHQILGKETKIDGEKLENLFRLQKDIPDTLRCKNAYAVYEERRRAGDQKVGTLGLARMAWMTAWAHRRAISEPFGEGILLDGARHVLNAIKKAEIAANAQEEGIRLLTTLYREKERFDVMERQIMRIIQAGYYNRMGLNFWADGVLRQVLNETQKKYANPGSDPWQKIKVLQGLNPGVREKTLAIAKNAVAEAASVRLNCLKGELQYLGVAAALLQEGLEKQEFAALDTPTYFYLLGEFERRRENHSRALFWLQAARQIAGKGEFKIEHCAPDQIDLLKRYVRDRRITPPANPAQKRDLRLAQMLAPKVRSAQAVAAAKKADSDDVKALQGKATGQNSGINDVKLPPLRRPAGK